MKGALLRTGAMLFKATILLAPCGTVRSAPEIGQDLDDVGEQTRTVDDSVLQSIASRVSALEGELKATKGNLVHLQGKVSGLEAKNAVYEGWVTNLDTSVSAVRADASRLQVEAQGIRNELGHSSQELQGRIATVAQRSGRNWLFTILMGGLLAGLLIAGFFGLQRFFGKRVGAVGAELERINADVQAKLVKVDAELITSLEKLLQAKPVLVQSKAVSEVDHSLALKVADEVTRIEQNLAQMDASVKGHKQLTAAVKRMHENLQASGYQLPELLGKAFDEGMKVTAAFVPDENLQKDERIITRVFKPTVLHEGKMIQAGDIQVSQG